MRQSFFNNCLAVATLLPSTRDASANGTTVDRMSPKLSNFRSAMLVVLAGTVTDGTHVVKLQESANGTDWTDAPASKLQGPAVSITSATDERVFEVGYLGSARYLRAALTVSGSPATGGLIGAVLLLGDARRTPIPRS